MNRERFISLKEIINRVHLLGGDMVDNVTEDDVITYAIELIGVVGMPQLFLNKVETLEIHKNRAELPCDFVEEKAVKCCNNISFNASTDMFSVEESRTHVPTYKIQGDFIVTSIEEGYIKLAYTAVKTDEDGYPMIIDDQAFIRALVSYIVYKKVFTEYINGRLPNENIMERTERNYETDIAIATSKLTQPTQDEFDNIARMMNSFIFRHNAKKTGFKNLGDEMPKRPLHSNTVHFDFINPLH
jgi:hypothetical protein